MMGLTRLLLSAAAAAFVLLPCASAQISFTMFSDALCLQPTGDSASLTLSSSMHCKNDVESASFVLACEVGRDGSYTFAYATYDAPDCAAVSTASFRSTGPVQGACAPMLRVLDGQAVQGFGQVDCGSPSNAAAAKQQSLRLQAEVLGAV